MKLKNKITSNPNGIQIGTFGELVKKHCAICRMEMKDDWYVYLYENKKVCALCIRKKL